MSDPIVVVMPGASLMDITPKPWGVEVRCPGCGNVQYFNVTSGSVAFIHEDDCEVHAQIRSALSRGKVQ